jgi:hypothetical protein
MTQSATTSDSLGRAAASPVSLPRLENYSCDIPEANAPFRGLIVGVCVAAPIWLLIGFIFYKFL